jgi:hypothetical protein
VTASANKGARHREPPKAVMICFLLDIVIS